MRHVCSFKLFKIKNICFILFIINSSNTRTCTYRSNFEIRYNSPSCFPPVLFRTEVRGVRTGGVRSVQCKVIFEDQPTSEREDININQQATGYSLTETKSILLQRILKMKSCTNTASYYKSVVMTLLITASLSESFVLHSTTSNTHRAFTAVGTKIYAKNTNKNKKRLGGPRGAGRRGKQQKDGIVEDDDDEVVKVSIPEPSKIRKHIIKLDRPGQTPLSVCTVEVDDVEWFENSENDNPYGAKLWPSSLAISEFLASMGDLGGYDVLELGCGAGLVSIVAADSGARVVASDISPTVIKLCKIGWLETQKQRQKEDSQRRQKEDEEKQEEDDEVDGTNVIIKQGSLNTFHLDLFSERPLPMSKSSPNQKIVIAGAMMYDSSLAVVLAHRAFEACARGAWVIIGDDDTGEREGGRELFLSELDQIEKEKGVEFQKHLTSSVVKSKPLQWNEKQVKVLHINAPENISLGDSL